MKASVEPSKRKGRKKEVRGDTGTREGEKKKKKKHD